MKIFILLFWLFTCTVLAQTISITTTIPAGDNRSEIVDLGGRKIIGIKFPAVMDGTKLTVYTSDSSDVSTFVETRIDGVGLTIPVAVNTYNVVSPSDFYALLRYTMFVSDSIETSQRTITLYVKRDY